MTMAFQWFKHPIGADLRDVGIYDLVMTRYFISFNDGDMTFPREEMAAVGAAAHAVLAEAVEAGVWVFGGGFEGYSPRVVTSENKVSEGPLIATNAHIGGFAIIDVENDEQANYWAAKIAKSCRCSQEVRKIMDDPIQDSLLQGN